MYFIIHKNECDLPSDTELPRRLKSYPAEIEIQEHDQLTNIQYRTALVCVKKLIFSY